MTTEIDLVRTNPGVDPAPLHLWGWEVGSYLFLGGLAAGIMILTALLLGRRERADGDGESTAATAAGSRALRWMPFAAPAALSLGMLCLLLDLEHKLYVWRFYLALRLGSPMSWGAWILVAVYPVTLLYALAGLAQDDFDALARMPGLSAIAGLLGGWRAWAREHLRGLRAANIGLGIALGVYTGVLLGALGAARAVWNSALLGPLFLVSGFSAGAAFLMLFRVSDDERHALARWDMGAIVVELALIALYLIGLASGGEASRGAAALFLGGRFTATFWALVVIGGLVVPWVLEVAESRLKLRPALVAPALVLCGGLALRFILVAAGQA